MFGAPPYLNDSVGNSPLDETTDCEYYGCEWTTLTKMYSLCGSVGLCDCGTIM